MELKHCTKEIPGVIRYEIYELGDMKYVEEFDGVTGDRVNGEIRMYGDITVCHVSESGTISLRMPLEWVTGPVEMRDLILDLQKMDDFLAAVCEKYKIRREECNLEEKQ